MKKDSELNKSEEKQLSNWKKEKAKKFAVDVLISAMNGLALYGNLGPSLYFPAKPSPLNEENLIPKKRY